MNPTPQLTTPEVEQAIDWNLIEGFLKGIEPIPIMTVSEWAEKNRYLSSESAAEPGKWRNSRAPYLKAIMDDLSPLSPVNEVVVMKGVQLGFTEAMLNIMGCYIDINPCPIMYVGPTKEMVEGLSKSRLEPMIDMCPTLRAKIPQARSRDSGNTILSKRFTGGIAFLVGSNSASGMRSRPVLVLLLDEEDSYPLDVDGEGDPAALAKKRTSTFGDRKKVFENSTPTTEGASRIDRSFKTTDQRKLFLPCPHCQTMQTLEFDLLRWDKGQPETVKYKCNTCPEFIEERFKQYMLDRSEWRPTVPENIKPRRKGYHINSLYSPKGWLSWEQIATEWETAQETNDVNLLKVFVNTILGETWKEKGDVPPWENLYNRREDYNLNKPTKEVVFITAGVDVQGDRIEVEIVGWCRGKRSISLDYRVLIGNTEKVEVWDKLAEIVGETWQRADGLVMPLRMMAIDTGHNTTYVYEFCRRFDATKVIPIKGQDKQAVIYTTPKKVDVTIKGKAAGHIRLWHIGVSLVKSELYGWLRLEIREDGTVPAGYCHFPQYDQNYFKGLTGEQLEFKMVRGYKKYQWVKKFARNEPLDCRVYARAAAAIVGIDRFEEKHFLALEATYPTAQPENQTTAPAPVKKKSSFWK